MPSHLLKFMSENREEFFRDVWYSDGTKGGLHSICASILDIHQRFWRHFERQRARGENIRTLDGCMFLHRWNHFNGREYHKTPETPHPAYARYWGTKRTKVEDDLQCTRCGVLVVGIKRQEKFWNWWKKTSAKWTSTSTLGCGKIVRQTFSAMCGN